MPTAAKLEWIRALAGAGLSEIEVGSFVPPKLLPQMADAEEVVRESRKITGLTVLALVPNLKGAERAIAAGAHKLTLPISASRQHSQANLRRTPEEAIEEVARVCALRDGLPPASRVGVEANVATAFGCTMEGPVSEDWVMEIATRLARAGADAVGLSDTTGYGNPTQVKRMFARLAREIGAERVGGAHLHNTRGQGLANVVAALDAGVTTFDSSQGGIGGCPYAPGATGNIVTEDLFMLESMGCAPASTSKLIAARDRRGGAPASRLRRARRGPNEGFVPPVQAGRNCRSKASGSSSLCTW
jgi:hydroxymethylglutaryl-CoA lyase